MPVMNAADAAKAASYGGRKDESYKVPEKTTDKAKAAKRRGQMAAVPKYTTNQGY